MNDFEGTLGSRDLRNGALELLGGPGNPPPPYNKVRNAKGFGGKHAIAKRKNLKTDANK